MESQFIDWLRPRAPGSPSLLLGIGDDAALLALQSQNCVVTSDMLMDGVDFVLGEVDPRRIGHKSVAVNLSDLAAMAARPLAVIVSLSIPVGLPAETLHELYQGIFEITRKHGVALAGGDTNTWKHPLAISVTAIGEPTGSQVVTRSGASPGDAVLVTGSFGGSILSRHLDVEPRIAEALDLHSRYALNAMIDVSDGLSLDLSRLARESGCGAVINLDAVPISVDAESLASQLDDGSSALDHALSDGEDFELIFAVSPNEADRILTADRPMIPITRIGDFIEEPGLWQVTAGGDRIPLRPRGYEHQ